MEYTECVKCGNKDKEVLSIDHIWETGDKRNARIYRYKGGGVGVATNKQILCLNCHMKKSLLFRRERKIKGTKFLSHIEAVELNTRFLNESKT